MWSRNSGGSKAIHPQVAQLTVAFLQILMWAVIARALITWFNVDQGSTIYQVLYRITEPIIDPIRRIMPSAGMIDLSPLGAILMLIVMMTVVNNLTQV